MSKRAFGKSLDNILGAAKSSNDDEAEYNGLHREFKNIFPHEIIPGTYQPRKNFDQDALQELSNSIKEKGILQPLVVRNSKNGYELIAGERRWRAAQMAGLKQVPVVVCEADDNSVLAFSLIENIQREDLNVIEEASSLKRLVEEFSMTHEQIAKTIGKSRTMVTNTLRLLNLANPVKDMLSTRQLEMGHVRPLLSLDSEQQISAANIIFNKKMSVRASEAYINSLKDKKNSKSDRNEQDITTSAWEKELQNLLGVKTKIQINEKGKGSIELSFTTVAELKNIISKLKNGIQYS